MKLIYNIPLQENAEVAWPRFLYKASRGSAYVTEWLDDAAAELANKTSGQNLYENATIEEYNTYLESLIPVECPFSSPQSFADAVTLARYIENPIILETQPKLDYQEYSFLWKCSMAVEPECVIHDAILHCAENWSGMEFTRLLNSVQEGSLDYNARDAVSAMLYITVVWSIRGDSRRR